MQYGEFKRAFFAGEMIWFAGVCDGAESAVIRELRKLRVGPSCVEFLEVGEFLSRGSRLPQVGVEVQVVKLRAGQGPWLRDSLVNALTRLLTVQRERGYRVLLVSADRDPEWSRALKGLAPSELQLPIGDPEPVLDGTVHGLIEMASHHAEVRVSRITEKAAFFLEESAKSRVDGELVALVVLGLKRSDGKVLRFRDLLPNFHRYFEEGAGDETV